MIRLILVESDGEDRELLSVFCRRIPGTTLVGVFSDGQDVLSQLEGEEVDAAVIRVDIPGKDGFALGRELREAYPYIVLIFASEKGEHCEPALRMKGDGFLFKPYLFEDTKDAIQRANLLSRRAERALYVRTFGHFDVLYQGRPISFHNQKARELFALCMSRAGGTISMEEAIDTLWPGRPYDTKVKRLYRNAIISIREALAPYDSRAFEAGRGCCHVNRDRLQSDLFEEMEHRNHPKADLLRFMEEFSWSEGLAAHLYYEVIMENPTSILLREE